MGKKPMKSLQLKVIKGEDTHAFRFTVRRMINAGYVGRDTEAVRAHVEELRQHGVPPPPSVPMLIPVLSQNITSAGEIEVLGSKTSGEVEFVLLLKGGDIYVGVGSDHTDRALESISIVMSKQVCPNVLSRELWDYEDVKSHWDHLLLQSWTKADDSEKERLYQKTPLSAIISAEDILDLAESRMADGQKDGLVIFSGTVATLTGDIIYGSYFRGELFDPNLKRTLTCEYRVKTLDYLGNVEDF